MPTRCDCCRRRSRRSRPSSPAISRRSCRPRSTAGRPTRKEPTSGTWNAGGQRFEWSQAQRVYTHEASGRRVEVTITSWPQMIEGQRAMQQVFSNPQLLALMNADPNKKMSALAEGGFQGWKSIEKEGSAQAILLGQSLMVMVDSNSDDPATLDHHWRAIDLKKLSVLDAAAKK